MARRKPKAESTVSFNITIPRKLAGRLDAELSRAKELVPYQSISRSAFLSHALGEWCALLDDPTTRPTLPSVRVRLRPPVRSSRRRKAQLTHEQVRSIRADARPLRNIARDMRVDISTVSRVKNGRSWSSVT